MALRRICTPLVVAMTLLLNTASAQFPIVNMTDSERDGFFAYNGDAAVNESGSVAFRGTTLAGVEGLFISDGQDLTQIAARGDLIPPQSDGNIVRGILEFSLDDTGALVFTVGRNFGEHILRWQSGQLSELLGQENFSRYQDLALINSREFIFRGTGLGLQPSGIFSYSEGFISPLTGPAAAGPSINIDGVVSYFIRSPTGGLSRVFAHAIGGSPVELMSEIGEQFRFVGPTVINDAGVIAFGGGVDLQPGQIGIVLVLPDGVVEVRAGAFPISGNSGPTYSLNDKNFVSFLASGNPDDFLVSIGEADGDDECDEKGVWVSVDEQEQRNVACVGGELFGSVVINLDSGTKALSNSGFLAFNYELLDGRKGIARADLSSIMSDADGAGQPVPDDVPVMDNLDNSAGGGVAASSSAPCGAGAATAMLMAMLPMLLTRRKK